MAEGAFKITEEFERLLCRYTGAPYAVAVDNCSNALFLSLFYWHRHGMKVISIPNRTYPSVPCEIIRSGNFVEFNQHHENVDGIFLKGAYNLGGTRIWDSALRFTRQMYLPGQSMCVSFTGPYKHLKLGKGGAILTDDPDEAAWLKRARFSGRRECSYHEDSFDMLGWNYYMMPELAARGILLMGEFMSKDLAKHNNDLVIAFPDLSAFPIYSPAYDHDHV